MVRSELVTMLAIEVGGFCIRYFLDKLASISKQINKNEVLECLSS